MQTRKRETHAPQEAQREQQREQQEKKQSNDSGAAPKRQNLKLPYPRSPKPKPWIGLEVQRSGVSVLGAMRFPGRHSSENVDRSFFWSKGSGLEFWVSGVQDSGFQQRMKT